MKKLYALLIALICLQQVADSQTFTTNTNVAISDNAGICVAVNVSGLPNVIDSSFGLCSVTVNLLHSYDADIDLLLISPWNDSIMLSNNQGSSGADYTATVFEMSAVVNIMNGAAPFTGSFLPEMSLNNFNDGIDPNGTWSFCVVDEAPTNTGQMLSISLEFCANPPVDPPGFYGPCSVNNGAECYCPDGSQDCDLLPDMTASADIIMQQHTETPGLLTLSNATPNIGWGPMEIHSSGSCWCDTVSVPCSTTICPNNEPPTEKLTQRIYHKNGTLITSYDTLTSGTMSYHPSHGHVHVNDWAEFTLRTEDLSDPNPTHWPIIADGAKVSFCLVNLGNCTANPGYCRDSLNNPITMADIPNAPFGVVSGCGLDQGIYTGMLDIYGEGLPGMSIDLTNVCNGNYYLVSITDPDNDFVELNDSNNYVAVPITITMQHTPLNATNINLASVSGNSVILSYNNTDVTSAFWDFGDGNTDSTLNTATHTYAAPGSYTIILTLGNPCGTYVDTLVFNNTGVDEIGNFAASLLSAAPNPANGSTVISYRMPESGQMQLEVYNLTGQRITVLESGSQSEGLHTATLDFDALGLSNGAYFLRLTTPSHYSMLRLVNSK
jgi:subtilisin-like proprotein convertase family protein